MHLLRTAARAAALAGVTGGLLALPTVTSASAAPRPVSPRTTVLSVPVGPQAASDGAGVAGVMAVDSPPLASTTTPEQSPAPFSLVGATLPAGSDLEPEDVQVRTRTGGTWSGWQVLQAEDAGPDAGTAEAARVQGTASAPVWVGPSDGLQVRVTPGADDTRGGDVRVVLVDPGSSPADGSTALPADTAGAATAVPRMYTRAQWGADESLRCKDVSYNRTIKAAVVHHTAGSNGYTTVAQAMQQLRADYAYHVQGQGWCDLGYNFVVDKFGNVYEGRAGGVAKAVVGAHAGGFNTDTVGVAMLGDFSTVAPTAAMRKAVTDVVAWKLSIYDRNPWGTTTLTSRGGGTSRYAAGTVVTKPVVMGHRDVGATACPGTAGYAILSGVRDGALRDGQNADYVQALYGDMLGRKPSSEELAGWTRTVSAADRGAGARGLARSQEYLRRAVTAAYTDVLGRRPDAAGLQGWVDALSRGQVRLDDLPRLFLQSQELYLRAGGTDGAWVDALYRRALDRASTSADRTSWARTAATRGRAEVVRGIYDSRESALQRVDNGYTRWLRRPASAADRSWWAPTVVQRGDEALRESLMVSAEYLARARAAY